MFFDFSAKQTYSDNDEGIIPECFKKSLQSKETGNMKNNHIWTQNVQFLNSDNYDRKYWCTELGLQTCLLMPYFLDGEFEGCIEFFSVEEWPEISQMVEKI